MYCQSGPGGRGEGRRQEGKDWRGRQTGRVWSRIMMIQNNIKAKTNVRKRVKRMKNQSKVLER